MEYDGILIGSGHNNLILQAYLGRAGLKTICLEQRSLAGGGLTTVEDQRHPGVFHNTHSFFHRAITQAPWFRDLELGRRGAEYIEPEMNVALLLRNGGVLEWWTDFERTRDSFARLNAKDAAKLQQWRDEFVPILDEILTPENQAPPVPPEERRAKLEQTANGRRLLEVSRLSPLEFVTAEFEDPSIQAGLLFFNGLREVDLRSPGFGHHIPALLASRHKAQMCRGGSANLAKSLLSAIAETGGEVRLNTTPRRICVENGRVTGVETMDGEFIRARQFVVSGLNPVQTFLELIDSGLLPAEWIEKVRNFRFNLLAPLFALYVNLKEPPRYTVAEKRPDLEKAFMMILGLDRTEQFLEIVRCHEQGTIPPTVMWGTCPTMFDPSQAPAGHHTAFMWEKLPYRLHGSPQNWDVEREEHGRQMLDVWAEYAPNMRDATVDWFVQSPLDTERTLPNMREGDLLVGSLSHGQNGYNRPFAGAGHYRGYLPGLYLCGGSCFPTGNITGLPGYNCAQVLLSDLGVPLKR